MLATRANGLKARSPVGGRGVNIFADGNRYEGEFLNGNFHGYGTYWFTSGDKYEGELAHGKQHGKGIYTWADGRYYDGTFKGHKMHGMGLCRFDPNVEEPVECCFSDGNRISC